MVCPAGGDVGTCSAGRRVSPLSSFSSLFSSISSSRSDAADGLLSITAPSAPLHCPAASPPPQQQQLIIITSIHQDKDSRHHEVPPLKFVMILKSVITEKKCGNLLPSPAVPARHFDWTSLVNRCHG
ncbi:hypothetical protein JOB18_049448 [Solea senegalensis]|uniref:Uncharacterized protein n=1 Tax=Solea senegalensis TaxID=28829 RepID=A0AAV6Q0H7_SOLSE|nr:hypothetical protein JOB18_049448 [Solea senegalensis]